MRGLMIAFCYIANLRIASAAAAAYSALLFDCESYKNSQFVDTRNQNQSYGMFAITVVSLL